MQVAVIAFGHVHFKAACAAVGVDFREARHISNLAVFKSLRPESTRLIVHSTASDRRQQYIVVEAKRLGFK